MFVAADFCVELPRINFRPNVQRKRHLNFLAGALLALACPAFSQGHQVAHHSVAAKQTFSFLGVTPDQLTTHVTLGDLECDVARVGKTDCTTQEGSGVIVGNKYVYFVEMNFNDGKMYAVHGMVYRPVYDNIMLAFTAKYGRPSQVATKKWQSQAGAVFDNVVTTWHFKGGDLILNSMGSNRDESNFIFFHRQNAPVPAPVPVNF